MLGRISISREAPRPIRALREPILDMPFLLVRLPEPCRPRHVRKAARLLVKGGVKKVLVPAEFPFWPLLERWRLAPVEPGEFCRAAAAPLALAALKGDGLDPAAATVVLRGDRVTRSMRMSALALCPQVRNVLISAPVGGAGLQAELRREYGVPALEERAGRRADLAIHFAPAAGEGKRVLDLSGPWPELPSFSCSLAGRALPEEADRLPLLAALWENGRIGPEEVTVFNNIDT